MTTFAPPVVATYGETDPAAPLVVLLHGRGSNEAEILTLAPHLPQGAAYAAVRAPIGEGGEYAWFADRGIGRPVAESLASTMGWFRGWLDDVAPVGRPTVLVGFSGGAAFAGGLALDDPARYAAAAILHGTLPFDAGVRVEAGRLAHLPVFVAQSDADQVIPAELLSRTWQYLLGESGAPATAHRDSGGHGLTAAAVKALHDWIAYRLHFLRHRAAPAAGPALRGHHGRVPTNEGTDAALDVLVAGKPWFRRDGDRVHVVGDGVPRRDHVALLGPCPHAMHELRARTRPACSTTASSESSHSCVSAGSASSG